MRRATILFVIAVPAMAYAAERESLLDAYLDASGYGMSALVADMASCCSSVRNLSARELEACAVHEAEKHLAMDLLPQHSAAVCVMKAMHAWWLRESNVAQTRRQRLASVTASVIAILRGDVDDRPEYERAAAANAVASCGVPDTATLLSSAVEPVLGRD